MKKKGNIIKFTLFVTLFTIAMWPTQDFELSSIIFWIIVLARVIWINWIFEKLIK